MSSGRIESLDQLNEMVARGGSKIAGNPLSSKAAQHPGLGGAAKAPSRYGCPVCGKAFGLQKSGRFPKHVNRDSQPCAYSGYEMRSQLIINAPKIGKYRNVKTERFGIVFDSAKECARYAELRVLEHAGEIKDLQRQVKFSLDVNGFHICNYFADHTYLQNGELIVEDTKSPASKTSTYRLKAKLMKALYGISVLET